MGTDDERGSGGTVSEPSASTTPDEWNPDIDDLLRKLDSLEETVDDERERETVRQTISLVERMPGSAAFTTRISKYTSRDIAQSFVGGIVFALPLLVEGGVFEIAAWFAAARVVGFPVYLAGHVCFVVGVTTGLLYYADFRDVRVYRPLFGIVPRRLVGVLTVAFLVSAGLMALWGRLLAEDPTTLEAFARVTVVWGGAAFGGALGDILPGESTGRDVSERLEDLGDVFGDD
ncbi:DUF2391 domain-containing protein [Halorubrum halodurans]|uniref:DUF2391 domain-containing protein n=1 Tax=Halorubrum halodurans TaxID=1383851 RepID=A0A256IEC9_9EURY|nr:DUF2391 domain-containing protein [Halorubrum halodurans]OYR54874.1 DUF2391 domain-containing protein [Halorubrum halodurans]